MKLLVLDENYPRTSTSGGSYFVKTRCDYYIKNGVDVSVVSFMAKETYVIDGVTVYSLKDYKKKFNGAGRFFDILICHAPNIKNHYGFINSNIKKFKKLVFFFHGHEVLKCSKVYPKPYPFVRKNFLLNLIRDVYDNYKLKFWKKKFIKFSAKSYFVFVSQWMRDQFLKWTKLSASILSGRSSVIYNSIGSAFEENSYDTKVLKEYDLITVRSNLDGSKYCTNVVCKIAEEFPHLKMLITGSGDYFKHYKKPQNLEWKEGHLKHSDILEYLNKSKCALMPTRTDAQGVMACEFATFGIPLITSNIDVCKEVFDNFENVEFIENENPTDKFIEILQSLTFSLKKNEQYFFKNTVKKELELFAKLNE